MTMHAGFPSSIERPAGRAAPRTGIGRVALIVIGSVFALAALAGLAAGATALVLDGTQRDSNGYLMTDSKYYATGTYAFVSGTYRGGTSDDVFMPDEVLGTVRIRVNSEWPAFVGIATPAAVRAYLGDVQREVAPSFDSRRSSFQLVGEHAPSSAPAEQTFWAAHASGSGTQILQWRPRSGDWRVVVMNADGSRGVKTEVSVGARMPNLLWIGLGLLGGAVIALILGVGLIYGGARERKTP
jgi:hypothetical protein